MNGVLGHNSAFVRLCWAGEDNNEEGLKDIYIKEHRLHHEKKNKIRVTK